MKYLGALYLLIVVVIFTTFREYGSSVDEASHIENAEEALSYYQSRGKDLSFLERQDKTEEFFHFGVIFDLPSLLIARAFDAPLYPTRRLLGALFCFTSIIAIGLCARELARTSPQFQRYKNVFAIIASAQLLLHPIFYGHAFYNYKDAPFATAFVWALFFLLKILTLLRQDAGNFKKFCVYSFGYGLACAFAMGIRIGALLLIAYFVALLGVYVLVPKILSPSATKLPRRLFATVIATLLVVVPVVVSMLVFWPYTHQGFFAAIVDTLEHFSRIRWNSPVRFMGESIRAMEMPWYYLPVQFATQTPELMLIALCIFPVFALILFGRFVVKLSANDVKSSFLKNELLAICTISMFAFLPVAYIFYKDTTLYDGYRHVLLILPPIVLLATWTLFKFCEIKFCEIKFCKIFPKNNPQSRMPLKIFVISALIGLSTPTYHIVKSHPYQYVYYNHFVGSLKGANNRYELDYWFSSYKEAADYLNTEVAYLKVKNAKRNYKIFCFGPKELITPFLQFDYKITNDRGQADFSISSTRWNEDKKLQGKIIHKVKRLDTTLCIITASAEMLPILSTNPR